MKTINPQIQAQPITSTSNMTTTPKHIIIKWWKTGDKKKILKEARGRKKTCWEQRNKGEDSSRFLVGNNVNKKMVESHL